MNRQKSARNTSGYTLMEIVAVIAISSVILLLCFKMFVSTTRLSAYCTRAIDHDNDARQAQRVFLDTIRNAAEVAVGVASYTTGPDTLVLKSQDPNRYIILGDVTNQGRLQRLELVEDNGVYQAASHSIYRLPLTALSFEMENDGRLVRMDITTAPVNPNRPDMARKRRFMATLRGAPGAAP